MTLLTLFENLADLPPAGTGGTDPANHTHETTMAHTRYRPIPDWARNLMTEHVRLRQAVGLKPVRVLTYSSGPWFNYCQPDVYAPRKITSKELIARNVALAYRLMREQEEQAAAEREAAEADYWHARGVHTDAPRVPSFVLGA